LITGTLPGAEGADPVSEPGPIVGLPITGTAGAGAAGAGAGAAPADLPAFVERAPGTT
jgi:hypothetical protein